MDTFYKIALTVGLVVLVVALLRIEYRYYKNRAFIEHLRDLAKRQ